MLVADYANSPLGLRARSLLAGIAGVLVLLAAVLLELDSRPYPEVLLATAGMLTLLVVGQVLTLAVHERGHMFATRRYDRTTPLKPVVRLQLRGSASRRIRLQFLATLNGEDALLTWEQRLQQLRAGYRADFALGCILVALALLAAQLGSRVVAAALAVMSIPACSGVVVNRSSWVRDSRPSDGLLIMTVTAALQHRASLSSIEQLEQPQGQRKRDSADGGRRHDRMPEQR